MNVPSRGGPRARSGRGRVFRVEVLEGRSLLATAAETFTGPSLTDLIQQARQGAYTAPQGINRMLTALQTQLTDGPLADLNAGTVDGNGFVAEVQALEASYEQNIDQQLAPEFPHIDEMLKLQGQRVVADMVSLNQQNTVGLLTTSDLTSQAQTAINSLTGGPLFPLGTQPSAYVTRTQNFVTDLNTLAQTLSTTAATPLAITDVNTTLTTEAEAYRADINAALLVTHPGIAAMLGQDVTTLENTANTIARNNSSDAQTQLTSAITTFDTAVLGTTGVFGPQGAAGRTIARLGYVPVNTTVSRSATTLGSVSGTATGGTATLTATLSSTSSGQGISGAPVGFTLDGAFAGTAVTDSNGVATLTGVPTSDATGTDTGGVVASFAGDITNQSSRGTGDLTVS